MSHLLLVSSPNGESPNQVETRAIPAIYSIIQTRKESKILFVLHGRLLRIILSSMLYQNLDKMSEFTHHNTSVNVIEAHIYSKQADDNDSPSNLVNHPKHITFVPKVLDSRIHLPSDLQ